MAHRYQPDPSISDILAAMRTQGTFIDITPNDARTLFHTAYQMAVDRLRRSVLVRDLMTADVLVLAPDMEAREAVRLLAEAGVTGAPVMREGVLVGIISVKDFLPPMNIPKSASLMALAARLLDVSDMDTSRSTVALASIMTTSVRIVSPEATGFEAAKIMAENKIRRLPVIEQNRLIGIVSRSDLIRAFGNMLTEAP